MKIIGTKKDGFIVEMSEYEMEQLTDTYYAKRRFQIGDEIDVDGMYKLIKTLNTHEDEMKQATDILRHLANQIDSVDKIITKVVNPKGEEIAEETGA